MEIKTENTSDQRNLIDSFVNDFENNSISEGFNLISKLNNSKQNMNPSSYKVNLAAALHDHISCTKLQPDLCGSGLDLIGFSSSNEPSFNSSNDFIEKENTDTLKDIILVQLDLIQHQQEQLLKKDRQLQSIRQDRESLCLRLDTMEKEICNLRDQLIKNKEDKTNKADLYLSLNKDLSETIETFSFSNLLNDPSNMLKNVLSNVQSTNTSFKSSSNLLNFNTSPQVSRGVINLKSELNENCLSNCLSSFKENETALQSSIKLSEQSDKKKRKISKNLDNLSNESNQNGIVNKTVIQESDTGSDKKNLVSKKKKSFCKQFNSNNQNNVKKSLDKNDFFLNSNTSSNSGTIESVVNAHSPIKLIETESLYEIVTNKDLLNSLDDEDNPELEKNQNFISIEIPSWRIHPISSCYSLEGTENLNDEVFNRRHAKLELDEKRRKRWDMQRLREQRNNEKLRLGRYYNSNLLNNFTNTNSSIESSTNLINSFYPQPKDIKFIEVADTLPVVAFGHPIPELPETSFSLPWHKQNRLKTAPKK